MQIYDSYLLKALDVKLPYSEEQPRVEWLLWRVSSQDDGETEHWNTSKVEEEDSCSKKKHHTQLTFNKSATTKNHKSLSSPLLFGRMEATCCQDEEPVFLRCGHQICVWVSKSHRCAGAGATPWWLRFPPLRRGSLQKNDTFFHWLLLKLAPAQSGMKEWKNSACYRSNCAHYHKSVSQQWFLSSWRDNLVLQEDLVKAIEQRTHPTSPAISAQKTEPHLDYKCMNI